MKQLFLTIVIGCFILSSIAGNNETRAERREREAVLDSLSFDMAVKAVEQMRFVIKADKLTPPSGKTIFIQQAKMNFITVEDDYTVIQVAVPHAPMAYNVMGGVTIDGVITHKEFTETKKGNIILKYTVLGNSISAQIQVTLLKDSNKVIAVIMPNFKGGDYTIYGELFHDAEIYQFSTTPNPNSLRRVLKTDLSIFKMRF